MKVQNINYITPRLSFCAQKNSQMPAKKANKALEDSLTTAGAWFGFGVVLDFLSRKCKFSESPTKNSLALNGILGIGAGIFTGVREVYSKTNKE